MGSVRWRHGGRGRAWNVSWGNPTKSQAWRWANSQENNQEQERRGGVRDWKGRIRVGLTPRESLGRDLGVFRAQVTGQLIVPAPLILNRRDVGWEMGSWV